MSAPTNLRDHIIEWLDSIKAAEWCAEDRYCNDCTREDAGRCPQVFARAYLARDKEIEVYRGMVHEALDLQSKYFGNCIDLHVEMDDWATKTKKALADLDKARGK